jgi:proteasome lid subunit RPN8/RPN11
VRACVRTPHFLSSRDEERLKDLLAEVRNKSGGLEPVGWYHSHTRSENFLTEADLEMHNRYFPVIWQVALVVRPSTSEPARAGFFFREIGGSIHASASYSNSNHCATGDLC